MASVFNAMSWKGLLRWFAVAALVLIATVALAACGDDDDDDDGGAATTAPADGTATPDGEMTDPPDGEGGLLGDLQEAGSITVGIANEAPYGFEDENGVATGEAPEVARVIMAELGVPELNAEVVDFGSLIPGLQAGQFDMIAAGMFITPDRVFNDNVLFSDPDYCAVQGFAVEEGNPEDIGPSFDSLAEALDASGRSVALLSGAVEIGYAEEAGITDDQMEVFSATPDMFEALEDGRVAAVALTSVTVGWEASQRDGIEATESFVYVDPDGNEIFGCGGYGFRQENEDFRNAFNDILVDMRDNDEILPIIQEFGFSAGETDQAKGLTVEDLVGEAPE